MLFVQSAVRELSLSSWCCRCCSYSACSSVSHCASASSWTSLRTRRANTDVRLIVLLEEGSHTKVRNLWVKFVFAYIWSNWGFLKWFSFNSLNLWVKSLFQTPCIKANANAIMLGNGNLNGNWSNVTVTSPSLCFYVKRSTIQPSGQPTSWKPIFRLQCNIFFVLRIFPLIIMMKLFGQIQVKSPFALLLRVI